MAPKRRPAAEAGRPRVVRRRPAALVVEGEEPWVSAEEVTLAQMEAWPRMRVQGEYWEEAVDCIVEMIELKASRGDRELLAKAMGTSSEALLRYISGVPEKSVRLHLCGVRCDRRTWEDGLIHVTQVKQHRAGDVAWEKNLETSRAEAERDELERVHLEAASRGKGRGLQAGPPAAAEKVEAPGGSGDSDEKKKKKKKKRKAKLRIEAVKDHTVLFKNTGMDADPIKRKRFRRRAKKLTKRGRNKDSSSSGSSASSTSSSQVGEGEDYFGELFTPQTSAQKMWERLPGVLTAQLLQDAQRSMLLQMGSMASTSGQLQPLTSQYVRQQMGAAMSPVIYREAIHWAATLDLMVQGKVASACDVMSQRLKSLEALAKGMKVDLIKQLELIQVDNYGLASSSELHQAGKTAHEENKDLRQGHGETSGLQRSLQGEGKDQGRERRRQGQRPRQGEGQEGQGRRKKETLEEFHTGAKQTPGTERFSSGGREVNVAEFTSLEAGAKKREAEAPGLSMHDIIKKSASVLRQDGSLTMRSNMENPLARRNPLFPLKTVRLEVSEEEGAPRRLTEEAAQGALVALNHLAGYGTPGPVATSSSSPTDVAHEAELGVRSKAEKSVSRLVQRNHMWGVSEETFDFDSFFKGRGVSYQGEEIKLAQKLSWEAVKQSLPEETGSLPLADFCRLGTLAYIEDFEKYSSVHHLPPGDDSGRTVGEPSSRPPRAGDHGSHAGTDLSS